VEEEVKVEVKVEKKRVDPLEYFHKTRDVDGALRLMPRWMHVERSVMYTLQAKGPNEFITAIQQIPRNSRLIYGHAYQSYVWNAMASLRLSESGLKITIGDLVSDGEDDKGHMRVREVTQSDVEATVLTMYDVVLPLPGYDVVYPSLLKEKYMDFMAKDEITPEHFNTNKIRDLNLPGGYRKLLVKPKGVEYKVMRYEDKEAPLSLTQREKRNGTPEPTGDPEGSLTAVRLAFSLPSSCYATMAVREILKHPTSTAFMSSLN